jgi:predicted nicotinamide N-methyase
LFFGSDRKEKRLNRQGPQHCPHPDPRRFIRENMRILPVPSLPEIRLYTAHPASGLWRLTETEEEEADPPPPYWAYQWAGGLVLAHHILKQSETVAGLRVLDLGAGSGIVGIAAAKAGALSVTSADIDPTAVAALALNAEANDVTLVAIGDDLTGGSPPAADIVLVGDLFYEQDLAERVTAFLDRCLSAGIKVLIGDPGRAHLPYERLRVVAEYPVADFGQGQQAVTMPSFVFALEPKAEYRQIDPR